MAEKMLVRILGAIQAGADTSNEIAEMLRHPMANVSAMLNELEDMGLIRKNGRHKFMNKDRLDNIRAQCHCWLMDLQSEVARDPLRRLQGFW